MKRRFKTSCDRAQIERRLAMAWTKDEWLIELYHVVDSSPPHYWHNDTLGSPIDNLGIVVGWEEGYSPIETLISWREYVSKPLVYPESVRRQVWNDCDDD